jgi:hypothetical protein
VIESPWAVGILSSLERPRNRATKNIMSERVNQAVAAFRALSHEERLKVIRTVPETEQRLIVDELSSVDEDDNGDVDEVAIAQQWKVEIERRAREAHASTSMTIPIEEHLKSLDALLKK